MSHGIWIKMRRAISSDPDVFHIAELTGLDRFSVVGRLHAVWSWADEHGIANCSAVSVTANFICHIAECDQFANAMREVGWLAGTDGAIVFPNFDRHNGGKAKKKAQNSLRVQRLRSKNDSDTDGESEDSCNAPSATKSALDKTETETETRQEGGRKPAGAGPSAANLDEFLKSWNASGLTQCRKLTDKRRKILRSRLADADWNSEWRKALNRATKSSFCRGGNDRGWKADVDWFLRPDTVTTILEGKYDDSPAGGNEPSPEEAAAIMERHAAEAIALEPEPLDPEKVAATRAMLEARKAARAAQEAGA